jgi:general secretion pathway protein G
MSTYRRSGFTLVEILIVVIILGILAAIVIPQFTSASEDARKSSLTSQLQTIRSQVELYKLQHRDQYPTSDGEVGGTWDWTKMTGRTNEDGGTTNANLGPYLQAAPKNNLNGLDAVGTAPAVGIGWVIDDTGKIFATGKNPAQWFDEATGNDSTTAPAAYVAITGG